MQVKSLLNIKGKETIALVGLNLMVITGLILFYVLVLRNNLPTENDQVLGTTNCTSNYVNGYAYHDKNTNGSKNSGEEGVGNVKVEIKLSNGKTYSTTTSSTDGSYKICMDAGDIGKGARLIFSNLPGGYYPGPHGSDSDTLVSFFNYSSGLKANYSLGLIIASQDNAPAEIGNRVWYDVNGNGLQDPGEPGISGVKVRLIDYGTGKQIASTTTNSDGIYYFKSGVVGEKSYLVRIEATQFDKGNPLDGLTTTKQVSDSYGGALNSDAPSGNKGTKDIEFPVVLGSAQSCNLCIHNYDIGLSGTRAAVTATSTPTATPTQIAGYHEPDFPACSNGYELVGTYSGMLRRDKEPKTLSHNFSLNRTSDIKIMGVVKEGHPEICPYIDPTGQCTSPQSHEEFKSELDGVEFFRYQDKGANINTWSDMPEYDKSNVASGTHTILNSHLLQGTTAESVDYKMTVCAKSLVISSTSTPSPTQIQTPSPTTTVGGASTTPTITSAPSITQTPTPTVTVTVTGASITPSNDPEVSGVSTTASPTGTNPDVLPSTGINYPFMALFSIGALLIGGGLLYRFRKNNFKIKLTRMRR